MKNWKKITINTNAMKNEYTRIKRSELDKLRQCKIDKSDLELKIKTLEDINSGYFNKIKELEEEKDVLSHLKTPTIWSILKSKLNHIVRLAVKRVS